MEQKQIEEFMAAYAKTSTIIFAARRFSYVDNVVYMSEHTAAITWRELLEQLGFRPEQLAQIFSEGIKEFSSWDQLGCIPLNRGDLFGKLATLLGKTIEVARDTGMDNIISGAIWTCAPNGKAVESEKWTVEEYWTA